MTSPEVDTATEIIERLHLIAFRVESVRELCQKFRDESDTGPGTLTNRGWLADTACRILEGSIDDQAPACKED